MKFCYYIVAVISLLPCLSHGRKLGSGDHGQHPHHDHHHGDEHMHNHHQEHLEEHHHQDVEHEALESSIENVFAKPFGNDFVSSVDNALENQETIQLNSFSYNSQDLQNTQQSSSSSKFQPAQNNFPYQSVQNDFANEVISEDFQPVYNDLSDEDVDGELNDNVYEVVEADFTKTDSNEALLDDDTGFDLSRSIPTQLDDGTIKNCIEKEAFKEELK